MLDVQGDLLEQEAAALRSAGSKVLTRVVDVASRPQIDAAYAAIRAELGPISIVVPNASIANFIPFVSMSAADWQRVIDINLTGVFHTVQAAVPDMIASIRMLTRRTAKYCYT